MAGWILLTLLMSTNSTAFEPTAFRHVRSEEARIRALVDEGYARSATFRQLADAVEALPCVVYIVTSIKLPGRAQGMLLHTAAGRQDMPVLRVVIRTNLGREESIGVIGHELQHVVEAMTGRSSTDGAWITDVFDRLDPSSRASTGVSTYETEKAIEVTRRVRDELMKARRDGRDLAQLRQVDR
jgi:hypothetical protein